uniref:Uncharacterized protein n=1 Tax=Rhizophora mucronata TaxID=61149 RepID=A0A2P2P1A2_RHIMU
MVLNFDFMFLFFISFILLVIMPFIFSYLVVEYK